MERSAPVAVTASRQRDRIAPRRLLALLSFVFIAVGVACTVGESTPRDCISLFGGTELCGPEWDSDNDTISTATETNPANRVGNTPIEGFYTFDTLRWDINRTIASGQASNGLLNDGMNLRDDSTGYTHYDNCDGTDVDDWGTGHLVRLIEGAGRQWTQLRSTNVRMQVGDLSRRLGGEFPGQPGVPGCEQGHDYHQQGIDVDMRYVRDDGGEGAFNICSDSTLYDRAETIALINSFLKALGPANARIDSIFVDLTCSRLPIVTTTGDTLVFNRAGHQNHFHVRIRDPDGPSN